MGVFDTTTLRGDEMRRLRGQMRLTRRAMWAEAIVRAFWPAFVLISLLIAAALLGGFAALDGLSHRIVLGVFGVLAVAALIFAGRLLEVPDDAAILTRLDEDHPGKPLSTLEDSLAAGRGEVRAEAVWRAHRRRAVEAAAALKVRAPNLRLASYDTWGLRYFAPALAIAGVLGAGSDWAGRLGGVVDPTAGGASGAVIPDRVPLAEAWATPPAYTGLDTVYLDRKATGPIRLPIGADLTVRVTDLTDLPALEGDAETGIGTFASLGSGLSEANGVLTGSGTLRVTGGGETLAEWQLEIIPDTAPTIELTEPPKTTVTRALELNFAARDDYGIVNAWAEIAPEGHDPEAAKGLPLPVISFALPLPITGDADEVADSVIRDLTAHPWAGAEVELLLSAEDGAAQVGTAEPVRMVIPGRNFQHPLARALVEQRRDLALDYGQSIRVLDVLQAVTRRPQEVFGDNSGAYLGVRTAIRRLVDGIARDDVADVAPDVVEFLWLAALSLEDGNLSDALERLRQAQEALRQALESGSDEDIRRAMDELRAALDDYLQQLAEQMQRNPQQQQQGQMNPDQLLSQQDLQDMLDRLQQQAESGMRDQARDLLSELNRMLENLQAAQPQMGPGQQAMQELQDMIQQQRDLSDQTFDEMRRQRRNEEQLGSGQMPGQRQQGQQPGQQQPGFGEGQGRGEEHGRGEGQRDGQGGEGEFGQQQGGGGNQGLAQRQEALRRQLEELTRGLGGQTGEDAARALEDAARAMQDAARNLGQGENSEAVQDQMEALDSLNEGAQALAEQMQQGQGDQQAQGNRRGRGQAQDQMQNDPFDRPSASFGALDGRSTKVPNQDLIDRAREIMEELRRRSSEPERPQLELDYLDRLMDQF